MPMIQGRIGLIMRVYSIVRSLTLHLQEIDFTTQTCDLPITWQQLQPLRQDCHYAGIYKDRMKIHQKGKQDFKSDR